jgi:Ca2+-transporting ATPase
VLATARKDFDPASFDSNADLLPQLDGLTLLALVGIVDPPRPTARMRSRPRTRPGSRCG